MVATDHRPVGRCAVEERHARLSTTLADLVYAAILCRDFFGSAGIAEAVA
jgi:hypothetical protein